MKVALVVSVFPNASETFVAARFRALVERGWDVHIFCERSDPDLWSWFPDIDDPRFRSRVHVRRWRPSRTEVAATFLSVLLRCLWDAPVRTIRYVVRGLRAYGRSVAGHLVEDAQLIRFGPDILHFEFGALAINREAVADMLGAALVVSLQGWDINYVGLDDPTYYSRLWERIDAAHFVSHDLLERARRRGFPITGPGVVVHNGIDTSAFDADGRAHTEVAGSVDRPLRVVSVGRLHWKKGYAYALQAVRMLADAGTAVDYRIIGEGEGRDAVLYDIDDLGVGRNVTLVGALPASAVRDEMAWADVLVHPAVSEGFCIAVTEAQAMRLPVVVSDADGLRENVADGSTGYVVQRRDAKAIADRLAELARDPALRDRMGRAGEERVRTLFTHDVHVKGVEGVYELAVRSQQR